MANDLKLDKDIQEMLYAAARDAWTRPHDNFACRREFEQAGVKSEVELKLALEEAIKDHGARSFDRAPSPGQTDKAIVIDAKIVDDKKKEHQITVILNPDRDEQGRLKSNSTAYINDPRERSGFSRSLESEHREGNDPKVLLRGPDLRRSEEQSLKSPISRLDGNLGGLPKPTYEREKQVTPKQEIDAKREATLKSIRPSLLERLQQQKPDITKDLGERQRTRDREHGFGR